MKLTDKMLTTYVSGKLALPGDDRNEHRKQVNRLLDKLDNVLAAEGSYRLVKFRRAGSLEKGTSNRPRAGKSVDGDVGVAVDEVHEPEPLSDADVRSLQAQVRNAIADGDPPSRKALVQSQSAGRR